MQETGKALDLEGLPDKQEDSSFVQDDDDDEFASQQKKDQARMEMARREKNLQELLERKRKEGKYPRKNESARPIPLARASHFSSTSSSPPIHFPKTWF